MANVKDPMELRNGDNLQAIFVGGSIKYFKIRKMDNIFYKDRHAALAADGTESYANVTNLDPPIDQLYYIFSAEIDGNFRLLLKQPAATNRWGTNRSPTGGHLFDISSPVTSDRKIEVWCSENYPPAVQIENHVNVTLDRPIIWWIGKRFSLVEIPHTQSKPDPEISAGKFTPIQIGGIAE
jgi:hypothetical protein